MRRRYTISIIFSLFMVLAGMFILSIIEDEEDLEPRFMPGIMIQDNCVMIRDTNLITDWDRYSMTVTDENGTIYNMDMEWSSSMKACFHNGSWDPEYDTPFTYRLVETESEKIVWEQSIIVKPMTTIS